MKLVLIASVSVLMATLVMLYSVLTGKDYLTPLYAISSILFLATNKRGE